MKKRALANSGNGRRKAAARGGRRPKTIEEKIAALMSKVPKAELRKIPTDLSANHDYYLYGLPKRWNP